MVDNAAVQSQKAVTSYFSSKQLLPFVFAKLYSNYKCDHHNYFAFAQIIFRSHKSDYMYNGKIFTAQM